MIRLIEIVTVLCLLLPGTAFAQNRVGDWYQYHAQGKTPIQVIPFQVEEVKIQVFGDEVTKRYIITADLKQLKLIMRKKPDLLDLAVPYGNKTYILNLARVDITAAGFKVKTSRGRTRRNIGVQYRGIVDGNPEHIASLNLTSTDKSAVFSTEEGNFVVTRDDVGFTVFNQEDMKIPSIDFCETAETSYSLLVEPLVAGSCKTVNVYFECDYAFYQTKGSNLTTLTNYVVGLFNQTATIYANEGISIQTSQIFVWTTPDPYASMSASATLTAFRANRGTSFNGHLAHFLSTRSPLGGIAYVNVLCNKAYAYGVSRVTGGYSNFPTYSWSVNVLTHELGHNLGSPHTQSCSWSGGAIDNCYTTEGGCPRGPAPVNGGTIMSYCHMTNYGINFNNGFGPLPGNLIRSRVANAACVPSTANAQAPTSLAASNITSTSATLSWSAVPSSYTLQYKPTTSGTWIIIEPMSTNTYNLTGLTAGTNYSWQVKSECSVYSATATFTTTGGPPPPPPPTACMPPTNLNETNITTTSATLRWTAPANASSTYLLYKQYGTSGWSIRSNITGSSIAINYLGRNRTYQWKVRTRCTNGLNSVYSPTKQFNTLP